MTDLVEKSVGVNLRILKALLLYSPERLMKWQKFLSYLIFLMLMFYVPIFSTLYFIMDINNINRKSVGDNGCVLAELYCYIFKLLPFLTSREKITKCISYLKTQTFVKLKKSQVEIIETACYICRRNTRIFIYFYGGAMVTFSIQPLFVKKLPLNVWLPFDPFSNLSIYYLTHFCMILGVGYPSMACAVVEPLIASLACLATAHLNVLNDNLKNMDKYIAEKLQNYRISKAQKNYEIFKSIQECIKHHHAILEFTELYENFFSPVAFSQFVGSIFEISFCCVQLTVVEPLGLDFWIASNYFIILLFQIYFYSYYGTALHTESDNVTNAVYMSNWYEYDIKSRKALIILMERSKRPILITVGKLLDMTLVTFASILKRAYSVLAVLNKIK